MKRRPSHVESYPRGEWILMDYMDFVVHVFTPTSREYYDLERLWGDAQKLAVAHARVFHRTRGICRGRTFG